MSMDIAHDDLIRILREHGINPTVQRIELARLMFGKKMHATAEDLFHRVNRDEVHVSKATVYNTLGAFAQRGLIREVIIDPTRTVYDSNMEPHHHFYNTETGELLDIDSHEMTVKGLPPLPSGTEMAGVEVIVKLRPSHQGQRQSSL